MSVKPANGMQHKHKPGVVGDAVELEYLDDAARIVAYDRAAGDGGAEDIRRARLLDRRVVGFNAQARGHKRLPIPHQPHNTAHHLHIRIVRAADLLDWKVSNSNRPVGSDAEARLLQVMDLDDAAVADDVAVAFPGCCVEVSSIRRKDAPVALCRCRGESSMIAASAPATCSWLVHRQRAHGVQRSEGMGDAPV